MSHPRLSARPSAYINPAIAGLAPAPPIAGPTLRPEDVVSSREIERANNLLRGTNELSVLSAVLFSDANLQIVQNRIRRVVYEKSKGKYVIAPQNQDELLIVLRSMYMQFGRNQPTNISAQVNELNTHVVDYSANAVLTQIDQYYGYIHDASTLPDPIAMPIATSNTGSKQLQPHSWL